MKTDILETHCGVEYEWLEVPRYIASAEGWSGTVTEVCRECPVCGLDPDA